MMAWIEFSWRRGLRRESPNGVAVGMCILVYGFMYVCLCMFYTFLYQ